MVAVAHKILVAIYHMLSHQISYDELGDLYLDKLNKHHLGQWLAQEFSAECCELEYARLNETCRLRNRKK